MTLRNKLLSAALASRCEDEREKKKEHDRAFCGITEAISLHEHGDRVNV